MAYNEEIYSLFKKTFEKDRNRYIKNWIVKWKYQDVQKPEYGSNLPSDFYAYKGPAEIEKWFNWVSYYEHPDYFPDETMLQLVEISRRKDQAIFNKLSIKYDWSKYDKQIGRRNAQDYLLANFYPVPQRNKIYNILDFGAGYGRQANIWTQKRNDTIYVGMDAIPKSYCLQHLYYNHLDTPCFDYVENCENFTINPLQKGIYHLPTWRHDLLPDSFFDLVICVQVLPEINRRLVKHMLNVFFRVLKPGGGLFIRDPGSKFKAGNKLNVDEAVSKSGFALEFRPYIIDGVDLHSFPRIWRKIDPEVEKSKKGKFSLKNELNYYSGGALKSLYRKIKA